MHVRIVCIRYPPLTFFSSIWFGLKTFKNDSIASGEKICDGLPTEPSSSRYTGYSSNHDHDHDRGRNHYHDFWIASRLGIFRMAEVQGREGEVARPISTATWRRRGPK